ncbi:MAG: type II toxin-antitoxin system RatA family toxin [Hyphomicrobiaceae bacterium]
MPSFQTNRRVPYTARQMFDLVADVERYPEFLPLCEGLTLKSREEKADRTVLVATMTAGYKAIREQFTTRVTLLPTEQQVLVEYLDGPFRRLENRWRFKTAPGGCDVDFYIDYEFRSAMLGLLVGALFDKAFRRFVEAFEKRAREIYGSPPGRTAVPARTA